jgi:glucose/arabinose dehydrogenase
LRTRLPRARTCLIALAIGLVLSVQASSKPDPAAAASIDLVPVHTGTVASPVGIVNAGDARLFVIEQAGRIRIISGGAVLPTPFLDVSTLLSTTGGERGLLGLAFHPNYPANPSFYIDYTETDGDIVIARYTVSGDPNVANAAGTPILTIPHSSESNHNGGQLQFGPDGYLYIAVGDGGGGGDVPNNAQNINVLLGKILRIDVNAPLYAIPATNPFAGATPGLDEIWAFGLRNPWRFTFDRVTNDMYIGDVGQNATEEIDFQPASGGGGRNYGWRLMEGSNCFNPSSGCNPGGLILPILEYGHNPECSVTGGYRYRGPQPSIAGTYFYADYCSGRIWGATLSGSTWSSVELLDTSLLISTFGEGSNGELYLADQGGGKIYRIDSIDSDGDGVTDSSDNCPSDVNPGQENSDGVIDMTPPKSFDDVTVANSDTAGNACDTDADNDGRSDANEASGAGCSGKITNALLGDTDGDRALDGAECFLGADPTSVVSAPTQAQCELFAGMGDADADGLLSWREFCYYNTSTSNNNTDGDNCRDGREVASVNANFSVDVIDLLVLAQHAGSYATPGPVYLVNFDVTKNGSIDVIDLAFVASQNGVCP